MARHTPHCLEHRRVVNTVRNDLLVDHQVALSISIVIHDGSVRSTTSVEFASVRLFKGSRETFVFRRPSPMALALLLILVHGHDAMLPNL